MNAINYLASGFRGHPKIVGVECLGALLTLIDARDDDVRVQLLRGGAEDGRPGQPWAVQRALAARRATSACRTLRSPPRTSCLQKSARSPNLIASVMSARRRRGRLARYGLAGDLREEDDVAHGDATELAVDVVSREHRGDRELRERSSLSGADTEEAKVVVVTEEHLFMGTTEGLINAGAMKIASARKLARPILPSRLGNHGFQNYLHVGSDPERAARERSIYGGFRASSSVLPTSSHVLPGRTFLHGRTDVPTSSVLPRNRGVGGKGHMMSAEDERAVWPCRLLRSHLPAANVLMYTARAPTWFERGAAECSSRATPILSG